MKELSTRQPRCRLLLVEDDHDNREVMARLLERSGCEVRATASVREAIEALSASRPDGVILDLMLPGDDGTDFLRHLRRAGIDNVRVAVLTAARPDSLLVTDAISLGADAVFSKPVLFEAVEEWIRGLAAVR